VSHVINGVAPQSHIYDVVALNSAGTVVGNLTDHGLFPMATGHRHLPQ